MVKNEWELTETETAGLWRRGGLTLTGFSTPWELIKSIELAVQKKLFEYFFANCESQGYTLITFGQCSQEGLAGRERAFVGADKEKVDKFRQELETN